LRVIRGPKGLTSVFGMGTAWAPSLRSFKIEGSVRIQNGRLQPRNIFLAFFVSLREIPGVYA
jgi:hypothetical protein